jgi:hypothetical protein
MDAKNNGKNPDWESGSGRPESYSEPMAVPRGIFSKLRKAKGGVGEVSMKESS